MARIAEMFGGGGHKCASGFSIEGPLSVAANRVLAHVRIHHSRTRPTEQIPADL